MAITHVTALRNTLADAAVDSVDGGSPGKLKIRAGGVVLATLTLSAPAFGAASAGAAALAGVPLSNNASATGTADNFQMTDSADVVKWSGSVSASGGGGDLILASTSITSGQPVIVTAGSYAAPA